MQGFLVVKADSLAAWAAIAQRETKPDRACCMGRRSAPHHAWPQHCCSHLHHDKHSSMLGTHALHCTSRQATALLQLP